MIIVSTPHFLGDERKRESTHGEQAFHLFTLLVRRRSVPRVPEECPALPLRARGETLCRYLPAVILLEDACDTFLMVFPHNHKDIGAIPPNLRSLAAHCRISFGNRFRRGIWYSNVHVVTTVFFRNRVRDCSLRMIDYFRASKKLRQFGRYFGVFDTQRGPFFIVARFFSNKIDSPSPKKLQNVLFELASDRLRIRHLILVSLVFVRSSDYKGLNGP